MDTQLNNIDNWVSLCRLALIDFFGLCKPFFSNNKKLEPKSEYVLANLFNACNLTSESSLVLLRNMKPLDAVILMRSMVEGSFKFAYLCTGNKTEHQQRLTEYTEELPEINELRDFTHANEFISKLNSESEEYKQLQRFSRNEVQLEEYRKKYPKAKRQSLSQKWSFLELVKALDKEKMPDMNRYLHIGYSYGMESHYVHMDGDLIHILSIRSRQIIELQFTNETISAKGIVEIFEMARFRAIMFLRFLKEDIAPVEVITNKYQTLLFQLAITARDAVQSGKGA